MGTEYLAVVFTILLHHRHERAARAATCSRVFTGAAHAGSIRCSVPIERLVLRLTGVDRDRAAGLEAVLPLAARSRTSSCGWPPGRSSRSSAYLPLNPDGIGNMEPTLAFNTISSFVDQHEPAALQRRDRAVVSLADVRDHVPAVRDGGHRHRGVRRDHPRPRRQPADARSATSTSTCTRATRPRVPAAGVAGRRSSSDVAGHADDVRGRRPARRRSKATSRRSPAASTRRWSSIKQLGTNGGGYFGPNSTHPFENPTPLSNLVETWSIAIIPMAMVWTLGFMVEPPEAGGRDLRDDAGASTCRWSSFGVAQEAGGNPAIAAMGVDQSTGSMEGKEVRFGAGAVGAVGGDDDGDVERVGQRDARLADAARRPDAAGRHVAEQHLRRRRRRLHQHADLRHRRGVRRRHDDRPHAGVPRQEGRGQGDEAGQPGAALASAGDPRSAPPSPATSGRRPPIRARRWRG